MMQQIMDALAGRKQHYERKFPKPHTLDPVLKDIFTFCGMNEDRFHKDPRKAAYWDGRRSVGIRIAQMLNLSVDEQFDIYGGTKPRNTEERP